MPEDPVKEERGVIWGWINMGRAKPASTETGTEPMVRQRMVQIEVMHLLHLKMLTAKTPILSLQRFLVTIKDPNVKTRVTDPIKTKAWEAAHILLSNQVNTLEILLGKWIVNILINRKATTIKHPGVHLEGQAEWHPRQTIKDSTLLQAITNLTLGQTNHNNRPTIPGGVNLWVEMTVITTVQRQLLRMPAVVHLLKSPHTLTINHTQLLSLLRIKDGHQMQGVQVLEGIRGNNPRAGIL